jgi:hypothetical protein
VYTFSRLIDCVVKTARRIYIFEFKLEGSAESALEQIVRRRYAERWLDDGREIVTVGVSFGQKERNIEGWIVGGRG